jgi:predicted nucleotidyltransferase
MAHFAKLDENNIVLEVNVVSNDALDASNEEASGIAFLTEWSSGYSNWKQTSYNASIRKNYAGIGYSYDPVRDAFVPPKCHEEATINEDTCLWDCTNQAHNFLEA